MKKHLLILTILLLSQIVHSDNIWFYDFVMKTTLEYKRELRVKNETGLNIDQESSSDSNFKELNISFLTFLDTFRVVAEISNGIINFDWIANSDSVPPEFPEQVNYWSFLKLLSNKKVEHENVLILSDSEPIVIMAKCTIGADVCVIESMYNSNKKLFYLTYSFVGRSSTFELRSRTGQIINFTGNAILSNGFFTVYKVKSDRFRIETTCEFNNYMHTVNKYYRSKYSIYKYGYKVGEMNSVYSKFESLTLFNNKFKIDLIDSVDSNNKFSKSTRFGYVINKENFFDYNIWLKRDDFNNNMNEGLLRIQSFSYPYLRDVNSMNPFVTRCVNAEYGEDQLIVCRDYYELYDSVNNN